MGERTRLALRWIPRGAPALLDAGCASGYATRHFARLVESAAGIDVDPNDIERARRSHPGIDFRCAPLERIPHPDEAFDVVVCLDVLEHVEDERAAVGELLRVVRPGGTLILSTPHRGAFGFLDPMSVAQRLSKLLERVAPAALRRWRSRAAKAPDGRTWWEAEPEHRHYREGDLRRLLDASGWAGRYEVVRAFRGGLVAYPLGAALSGMWPDTRVGRVAAAAKRVDYFIPWGPLAYNIALKIRKSGRA